MSSADSNSAPQNTAVLQRRATDQEPEPRGASLGQSIRHWSLRSAVWGRRVRFADIMAVVLSVAAAICGIATYAALAGWDQAGPNPRSVLALLYLDLFLLLGLAVLVARRLVRLWSAHRSGTAGSKLHIRLVMLFGVISITPTIIIAVFSALFFTFGVQSWFSDRVRSALNESQAVAEAYIEEHKQVLRADVTAFAADLNNRWPQLSLYGESALTGFLGTQAAIRNLTEALVFNADGKVVAKTGYYFDLQAGGTIPPEALSEANIGRVAIVTGDNGDRVRALIRLNTYPAMYLYVGRVIDAKVLNRVTRTGAAVDEYRRLEGSRSALEIRFTLLFTVVALLLLMVSVWFGLSLANRLARPISDLINAAERVRAGDLTVRVRETTGADELASLSRAFNRMTKRIDEQQAELLETNAQLDERRRFTETVLDGVSAGVIGLDEGGHMTLPNRSAALLLGTDLNQLIGRPVSTFAPEFAALFAEMAANTEQRVLQREIQIVRGNTTRTLMVRLSTERADDRSVGYVITFDDITALQSAQRKAAWADVARRIAHEIKNPLTPIQLSAERLKRKYRDRLGDEDSGLFIQCTDTIIRHVGDIGQMVDEFSAFARMPAPQLKDVDLGRIVREGVGLQKMAFPQIQFAIDLPQSPVMLRLDARQVGQAVTNIVKNALESIESRMAAGDATPGHVAVAIRADGEGAAIEVIDNGVGLPPGERDRLKEPYVTTRVKGTGLGLAIVAKVVEDHGGTLSLDDAPALDGQPVRGARVTLKFPASLFVQPKPSRAAE